MKKAEAIARAEELGYSIRYMESKDELRFRKPGAAMSPLNNPYEYCLVQRRKRRWYCEEKVEPNIL
jgi:hypothetical protein